VEKPADSDRQRFRWGVSLAWGSFLLLFAPTFIQIFLIFRSIEEQKATGLGAVAGGLSEAFLTFGLVVALGSQLTALVFLARSFPAQPSARKLLSVLSMVCSVFILLMAGAVVWFGYFWRS
jgi:hypothetical protein